MKDYSKNINKKYLHSEITGKILQGFYFIMNKIGYGFGIEIFKKALIIELTDLGLKCKSDKSVSLNYKNQKIGEFQIDILVENKVNVMIICEENILRIHEVKLSHQLKNSEYEVGLLLNAHIDGEHKRLFYSTELKHKKADNVDIT